MEQDSEDDRLRIGGIYGLELAIEASDEPRRLADEAVRSTPGLEFLGSFDSEGHPVTEGTWAAVPGFGRVRCVLGQFRETEDETDAPIRDWVLVGFHVGALVDIDPRADSLWGWQPDPPADPIPFEWRAPINDFLLTVADRVAAATPVEFGIIGWEAPGFECLDGHSDAATAAAAFDVGSIEEIRLIPDASGRLRRVSYEPPGRARAR